MMMTPEQAEREARKNGASAAEIQALRAAIIKESIPMDGQGLVAWDVVRRWLSRRRRCIQQEITKRAAKTADATGAHESQAAQDDGLEYP